MAVKNTNTSPLLKEGANVTLTESGQVITISSASASPAGTDTQVQFNDGGAFGGDAGLTYNKTTNVLSVESIDFAQTPVAADAERRLKWDNDEGSLVLTLKGGNVTVPLGGEVVALVHNAESFTLTKGTVVYAFGASGQRVSVKRAVNTSDATSAQVLGVVAEPIATGAEGWVMVQGFVRGLDTSSYTQGDALYLSNTAGQFTKTKQYAPNHLVYVGFAVKINASSGEIFVKCQNGYEMDELHNVSAQSPSNNDILAYNTSTNLWEKKQLSAISGITGSGTSGQVSYFNGTNSITSESAFTWDAVNDKIGVGSNFTISPTAIEQSDANGLTLNGSNGSGAIYFRVAGAERARMDASGNFMVGRTGSISQITFDGSSGITYQRSTANEFSGVLDYLKSRGTSASPAAVQNGDGIFTLRSAPYHGSAFTYLNSMSVDVDGTFTSGQNPPTKISFYTNTANGSATERLKITNSGDVIIGGGADSGETLQITGDEKVNGKIIAGTANSTNGSEILNGKYTSGALTVLGTEYSTGGPVLGYAVKPSTSASGAFLSATGVNIDRGAYTVSGSIHKWYSGTTQTVAENSSVTMTERMSLLDNGKLKINGYTSTSSYTGTAQGLLGFANDGSVITLDDRVSGTGSTNQVAFFDGTKTIKSESAFVWDQTNDRLGISSTASFGKLSVGSGTGFVGFNVGTSSSPERANIFFDTDGTGWKMNIGKYQSSTFSSIMTVHDSSNVSIGSASDNGNRLQVSGKISVNTSGQSQVISNRYGANSDGYNTWIGGGGDSAIGSVADTSKGAYNTSYGWNCLLNITEGAYNNGQGVNVLGSLTTGSGNSAFGTSSSVTMSTGYGNSAFGNNSLEKGTTCYYNVALGNASLYNITTGYQNVGVGFEAGRYITAGTANQTSTNSVYIGTDARAGSNGNDNEIVIGATSRGNGTNSVTLGNTSITKTVLQGSVCIGNTSTSYKLEVTGDAKVTTGALGVNVNPNATDGRIDASNDIVAYSSDRRLKENIKDIESPIEKVQKLKGFTYNWNDLANQLAGYNTSESLVGVFAQDVQEVLPEAVKLAPFDNNGYNKSISGEDYLTVQYEKLVPLLIEAIKDLQNQINELKK